MTKRKNLNNYEGPQHDKSSVFAPSVKYVRYGPSYENLPEKVQDTEEGIYEILDGEEQEDGVLPIDEQCEPYDKLYFNY